MAIHPIPIRSSGRRAPAPQHYSTDPHRIEAWTQQATEQLQALNISTIAYPPPGSGTIRGAFTSLQIPLDDPADAAHVPGDPRSRSARIQGGDGANNEGEGDREDQTPQRTGYMRRRSSIQRDSLRRREALLKGREGSRRRQRWENDRLLHVPNVQPALPTDWEARPTHPVRSVPYFLAPLWDERAARRPSASTAKRAAARSHGTEGLGEEAVKVQKELRAKMKRAKGAKNLLMDLEETVRAFIQRWEEKEAELEHSGAFERDKKSGAGSLDECAVDMDSSDGEEIVFVGRDLAMKDVKFERERQEEQRKTSAEALRRDKLVFEGLVDDHGAAFGRWLVHSIGTYYGLKTWSITVGDPARREAYVGLADGAGPRRGESSPRIQLPKPLWVTI